MLKVSWKVMYEDKLRTCKTRQVARDLFRTNQENGSERAFKASSY